MAEERVERRLAAILVADAVGYSARIRMVVGKMNTDIIRPPSGFGGKVTDRTPPLGRGEIGSVYLVKKHRSLIHVEISDGTQQQRFSGSGRSR